MVALPIRVSVVVPASNAAATIGECLRALSAQSVPREAYEVIVVVDRRTTDGTAGVARAHGATVIVQSATGAAGARNDGIAVAHGTWIAFTDADCIPSRGWLKALLEAVEALPDGLGAAGPTVGYQSNTPAARFVDLSGGLQAERHLAHERYPWAPTTNVMYARAALAAVDGFDPRFDSYEGCDLHTRLMRKVGTEFRYVPRALVHHRHRAGWRAFWRQQVSYGRGFAQFFRKYEDELRWSATREIRAWLALVPLAVRALSPGKSDTAVRRRGTLVKSLAQRIGFASTYWSRREVGRWRAAQRVPAEGAS